MVKVDVPCLIIPRLITVAFRINLYWLVIISHSYFIQLLPVVNSEVIGCHRLWLLVNSDTVDHLVNNSRCLSQFSVTNSQFDLFLAITTSFYSDNEATFRRILKWLVSKEVSNLRKTSTSSSISSIVLLSGSIIGSGVPSIAVMGSIFFVSPTVKRSWAVLSSGKRIETVDLLFVWIWYSVFRRLSAWPSEH